MQKKVFIIFLVMVILFFSLCFKLTTKTVAHFNIFEYKIMKCIKRGLNYYRNHFSLNFARPGSQSPPLPPPPPPEEEHQDFGRPRTSAGQGQLAPIVPDDQNLPGWVPKNYIEKGDKRIYLLNTHSNKF